MQSVDTSLAGVPRIPSAGEKRSFEVVLGCLPDPPGMGAYSPMRA
jgi:hypothetical protein